jgi:hypothetical protein
MIKIEISPGSLEKYLAFNLKDELSPELWDEEEQLRPVIKDAILAVVKDFLDGLDLTALVVEDVVITGSLANYNWSDFSDIDVHLLVDFKEINPNTELVKKFFDAVKSNWNKIHDIRVKGYEVELYVQDVSEPHISTGVYSVSQDAWLVKPKRVKPEIDRDGAKKKARFIQREVDKLEKIYDNGDYERAFSVAEKLKDKIKRMRKMGLDRAGIYSPENLAFKILRRSGDIGSLFEIYTNAYDKNLSLAETLQDG